MMKDFWAAQQKRERELILEVLRTETGPVDSMALWYALDALGIPMDKGHFVRHLDYLEDKGYLRATPRQIGEVKVQLVEITSSGRDLLSGFITDEGVGQSGAA